MSVSNSMIRRAARQTGVPVWILQRQVGAESGGRQSAKSPKGAKGVEQLMPGTAASLSRKYGLNTNTVWGNLLAGAHYLKEQYDAFGRWDFALAAYNAGPNAVREYGGIPPFTETHDYVRKILHGEHIGESSNGRMSGPDPGGVGSIPTSPAISKKDVALSGLASLAGGDYSPISGLAALRQAAEGVTASPSSPTSFGASNSPMGSGSWKKWVNLAPNADRAGVSIQPEVVQFVGQIGKRAGKRLEIGTGTNHNQFVVGTQRQSDHWTGRAADIPAEGATLTRLGRLALIQAGMPRAQAMKVKGGLFNVGRYQIIFNTHEGGNHFNHLHVGVR